tara:strand:+ start:38 stop:313 length:276 start_codon:yes stop_codon:yes gene_type:complete
VEAQVAFGPLPVTKVFQMLEALVVAVVAEVVQLVAMELRVKAIMAVMQQRVREQVTIAAVAVAELGLLAVTLRIMKVDTAVTGHTATSQER